MAQFQQWVEPLKAVMKASSALFPGQHPQQGQQQGVYNAIPSAQQPLYHAQHLGYSPSAHYNQPTSYCPASFEGKPPQVSTQARKSFNRFRRYTKIVTIVSTIISMLLSLIMEIAMIYMTYTFYHTKNAAPSYPYHSGPWPSHTKLWPTFLLLGASGTTCLLNFGMLIASCCKSRRKSMFSMLYNGVHILLWIAITVLYRTGKTGDDMWGWSCSDKANAIQGLFEGVVDFSALCKIQTSSWQTSIVETSVKIVCTGIGWTLNRKQGSLRSKIIDEIGNAADDQLDL